MTITLSDESGIEILVSYSKDSDNKNYVLDCIEVVIAGAGINITKQLSLTQYHAILDEVIQQEEDNQ
jgi:hypothetical protein